MTNLIQELDSISGVHGTSRTAVSQICFDVGEERICIPLGTGPTIPSTDSTIHALAAGELHGKMFRELVRRFELAERDELRFRKELVRDLLSSKAINAGEVQALDEIIEITSRPGKGVDVHRLRRIFENLVDTEASPMAVTIASIAVNSGGAQASGGGGVAGADVGGAIGGGALGGLGGAVLGASFASFGAYVGSQA